MLLRETWFAEGALTQPFEGLPTTGETWPQFKTFSDSSRNQPMFSIRTSAAQASWTHSNPEKRVIHSPRSTSSSERAIGAHAGDAVFVSFGEMSPLRKRASVKAAAARHA